VCAGFFCAKAGEKPDNIEFTLLECETDPEKDEGRGDERITSQFPFRGAHYTASASLRASRFRCLR
jgi:hypothetical protein